MRNYFVPFLLLLFTMPALAIEVYQAKEIEVYRGGTIEPYQGGGSIAPQQSPSVQPNRGYQIQPNQGGAIEVYQLEKGAARETPAPAPGYGRPEDERDSAQRQRQADESRRAAQAEAKRKVQDLLGLWQTNVPGVAYTTPSTADGWAILHVSPGAKAGLLKLDAGGTYSWESYGGKKGRWVESGDPAYPIAIIDTVEKREWKVGFDAKRPVIFIWDGSIWYEGRKAEFKR